MNLKTRLKVALESFIDPSPKLKTVIQLREKEPQTVFDNQLLAGKNVLITGAGQNIGRSIALEMAKQGANIYFTDISESKVNNLEQELSQYSVSSKGFISDITKTEDTDLLIEYLTKNSININILVNNVGIQFNKIGINQINLEDWQQIFNTNVFGPIYLTQKISELMISKKSEGSVIFLTSIHQFTIFRESSYSASKAALGMIIQELAIDLAPHQIRVNGIAPGWVKENEDKTPLYHPYTPLYNSSINPDYIGRAAIYLASDYFSKFTTGIVLKIDAGLSLYNHHVAVHPPE